MVLISLAYFYRYQFNINTILISKYDSIFFLLVDHSRVKLQDIDNEIPESDYINANHINVC